MGSPQWVKDEVARRKSARTNIDVALDGKRINVTVLRTCTFLYITEDATAMRVEFTLGEWDEFVAKLVEATRVRRESARRGE